nr:lipase [Actinomycetales bacterium]
GVAAMAPAANLPVVLDELADSVIGGVFGSFALAAYAGSYPDVEARDYVRPGARLMVQSMQQRCLTDPGTLVSLATAVFSDAAPWSRNPAEGALGRRLEENIPTLPISFPVLLAQGGADTLISSAAQDSYVADRCAAGQQINYRTYEGRDHMGLVTDGSALLPELYEWTADRLTRAPAVDTC